MSILNVIKHNFSGEEVIYKHPIDNIKSYSQLIVNEGQTAVLLTNGVISKIYYKGTHTIKTDVIPFLNTIISLPYDGSVNKAELLFIKTSKITNIKWGSSEPILIYDKINNISTTIGVYGKYSIFIENPQLMIEDLIGITGSYSYQSLNELLISKIFETITSCIANEIENSNISIVEVNKYIKKISTSVLTDIGTLYQPFGIKIYDFIIESINVDEKLVSAIEKMQLSKYEISLLGNDYEKVKKYEALNNISSKENNSNSQVNDIVGLMAVANVFKDTFNNQVSNNIESNAPSFYFYIDNEGKKSKPVSLTKLKELISNKIIESDTLIFKDGFADWQEAHTLSEIRNLFYI